MHLILAELFVQQASDDTGDLNDAIPGGLDFMVSRGVDSSQSLSDMIGMCAEQLLQERGCRGLGHISAPPRPHLGRTSSPQEMVLRLGRASGERERGVLLLALNLLIPVGLQAPPLPPPSTSPPPSQPCSCRAAGLQAGTLEDGPVSCSALGVGSALNSAGLVGTNAQLQAYIDANFHMIVQFLRDRLTSPTRSLADKREALHGLAQVLYIMRGGELSHSWWGETVATLKVVP